MCLMFDMREDGEADSSKLAQMMQNLGVFISVKPKIKQTSKVQLHFSRSFVTICFIIIIFVIKQRKKCILIKCLTLFLLHALLSGYSGSRKHGSVGGSERPGEEHHVSL